MELLKAYNNIAKKYNLPEMNRGGFNPETRTISKSEEVWSSLEKCTPACGWLLFQSRQLSFVDGLPEPESDWGQLLASEAVDIEGRSLTLEQDGTGGWLLTAHKHSKEGDCLVDKPTLLAHNPESGKLKYKRYWYLQPEQGYVQVAACFTGFEQEK